MKYALAAMTLSVAVAAMLMLGSEDTSRGDTGASRTLVAPEPTIVTMPTIDVPEVSVAETAVTRAEAVASARGYAAMMHEDSPTLIDAVLTTQTDVRDRLRPAGATRSEGPSPRSSGISDGAAVWLIRMQGKFQDPSYPGPELPPPQKGRMFVVLNAATGQTLGYGHQPEWQPVP